MSRSTRHILSFAALVTLIVGALYAALRIDDVAFVEPLIVSYGYVGVFLVSIVSGFNLIVPVPAITFLPLFTEAGLSSVLIVLVIACGVTLADSISFYVGRLGRGVVAEASKSAGKVVQRLSRIREAYPRAPLAILFCFASFAPLPNEVLALPLGVLGYRARVIIPILFSGNLLFNTLAATGVLALFRFLEEVIVL